MYQINIQQSYPVSYCQAYDNISAYLW